MSVVGGAAGGEGEGAAGCNDKNKNPTIECGEQKEGDQKRGFGGSKKGIPKQKKQ